MNRESLIQNFGYSHWVLNKNLEDISNGESMKPATDGANCLNWVVGHVLRARNEAHSLLGLDPAIDEESATPYKQGNDPADLTATVAMPLEKLIVAFNASQEALMARLGSVSEVELTASCKHVLDKDQESTVAVQLAGLSFHESYHAGQTGIMRRLLGKKSLLPSPE